MSKTRKIIALSLLLIPLLLLALFFTSEKIENFLSKNSRVDASLLIVEGWLPEFALDEAYNEFINNDYDLIVTTGLITPELEFFNLYSNGYLIFYPKNILRNESQNIRHNVEVLAHSKTGGKYRAHFNLYINDSLLASFTADEKLRKYGYGWNGSLNKIDSITVQFDNDFVDTGGDINLYVSKIIIDNEFVIPYQFHSEYDIGTLDRKNREVNNYYSNSEIAKNTLIRKGIDSTRIIAVTGTKTFIHRTLASVIAFRGWLASYDKNIKGINIISLGTHSRRTWLTYKKMLGKQQKIGIISITDDEDRFGPVESYFKLIRELLDWIYYSLILIIY